MQSPDYNDREGVCHNGRRSDSAPERGDAYERLRFFRVHCSLDRIDCIHQSMRKAATQLPTVGGYLNSLTL